ncbi:MAG: hypothetical protein LBT44_10555 [Clostridiales bacterium]|jgi:hypothetical protein|nr:hypothetical protein [Clostridiales bacterium]
MKAERMKILQMLEDGKITADEATKLLEAVKTAGYEDCGENWRERFWDEEAQKHWEEKVGKLSQNVEHFSKDLGSRLESILKDVEPRFRSASKTIVEKTACIVEEISKSLSETLKNMEENHQCCDSEKTCCEEKKTGDAENQTCSEEKPEASGDEPKEN